MRHFLLRSLLALALLSRLITPAIADEWKFGMIGDTHDSPPKTAKYAGVAIDFIKLANQEFIRHNVDFVVQCGDLADAQGGQDPKGFEVRFDVAQDLRNAGIPFYAIRGNHDTGVMRDKQMGEWFIPGRKGTRTPKGYVRKGLDYGFRHKNASLYFMDIDNSLNPDRLVEWANWMASYRNNPNRPAHCIVFTHRNLHVPLSFRESLFGPRNESAPDHQNVFYKKLVEAGVTVVMTAHLHVHIRGVVASPDRKHKLNALVCGPCGKKIAPAYLPLPVAKDTPIETYKGKYFGYYIVTVSDQSLKIDYYGMVAEPGEIAPSKPGFTLVDSWVITTPAPVSKP